LILITGPWCDGELRCGQPIPGVQRIRWHRWRQRLPRALGLRDSGARQPETTHAVHCVSICTDDRASYGALADACLALGLQPTRHPDEEDLVGIRPEVMLIVGWRCASRLSLTPGEPRRVLLLDFVRPDDVQRAGELGFAAVLAQPLLLADLAAVLPSGRTAQLPSASRVA
jgi:hypothetical protein